MKTWEDICVYFNYGAKMHKIIKKLKKLGVVLNEIDFLKFYIEYLEYLSKYKFCEIKLEEAKQDLIRLEKKFLKKHRVSSMEEFEDWKKQALMVKYMELFCVSSYKKAHALVYSYGCFSKSFEESLLARGFPKEVIEAMEDRIQRIMYNKIKKIKKIT